MAKVKHTKNGNVKLTMSFAEAETLRIITQKIGGCPVNSRRAHTDSIGAALHIAGFEYRPEHTYCTTPGNSALYFKDSQ